MNVDTVKLTHLGTATLLLEVGPLRLLTDPALDPAGQRYRFAPALASTKTVEPRVPAGGLGALDAVLLSHDHHADNLDPTGRALLPSVARVLTTRSGARRLGGNAAPLGPWDTTTITARDGFTLQITATPARHGPPGIGLVDHETIGFLLAWSGQRHGPLWISGDTVYFSGIDELARRTRCGTAIVHLGAVGFGLTGPLRYTFDGAGAARAAKAVGARTVIPVHYDGWTHFREDRAGSETAFARAGLADRVRWLDPGVGTSVEA